jgi:hypothetical protein
MATYGFGGFANGFGSVRGSGGSAFYGFGSVTSGGAHGIHRSSGSRSAFTSRSSGFFATTTQRHGTSQQQGQQGNSHQFHGEETPNYYQKTKQLTNPPLSPTGLALCKHTPSFWQGLATHCTRYFTLGQWGFNGVCRGNVGASLRLGGLLG